jgi:transposase-like protein
MRKLLEVMIQKILDEEMKSFIGADLYERSEERRGYRNGYKSRTLKTRVGKIELNVPQERDGKFSSTVFERYRRSEKAFVASIIEMYLNGVSTRKVKKITEALCATEISKSQVSELVKTLDEEITTWQERPLEKSYPYLVVDARYEKIRRSSRVVTNGVLIVAGIGEDGYRETLGIWVMDTENEATWSDVFCKLKERGLTGVRYIVSDNHKGLRRAIGREFQGVIRQRCQVHFIRNILSRVTRKDRVFVCELLREITGSSTKESARRRLEDAAGKLREKYPRAADILDEEGEEILSVYELPLAHRKFMRTTNMLERLNEEIKRRTRVIRIFPDEGSCLRLIRAFAIEENEKWFERHYLDMGRIESELLEGGTSEITTGNNGGEVRQKVPTSSPLGGMREEGDILLTSVSN